MGQHTYTITNSSLDAIIVSVFGSIIMFLNSTPNLQCIPHDDGTTTVTAFLSDAQHAALAANSSVAVVS